MSFSDQKHILVTSPYSTALSNTIILVAFFIFLFVCAHLILRHNCIIFWTKKSLMIFKLRLSFASSLCLNTLTLCCKLFVLLVLELGGCKGFKPSLNCMKYIKFWRCNCIGVLWLASSVNVTIEKKLVFISSLRLNLLLISLTCFWSILNVPR